MTVSFERACPSAASKRSSKSETVSFSRLRIPTIVNSHSTRW